MEGEHRHCKNCGRVCAPDAEYCSKSCRREREQKVKSRRNYVYILYALMAVTALFLLLQFAHL